MGKDFDILNGITSDILIPDNSSDNITSAEYQELKRWKESSEYKEFLEWRDSVYNLDTNIIYFGDVRSALKKRVRINMGELLMEGYIYNMNMSCESYGGRRLELEIEFPNTSDIYYNELSK